MHLACPGYEPRLQTIPSGAQTTAPLNTSVPYYRGVRDVPSGVPNRAYMITEETPVSRTAVRLIAVVLYGYKTNLKLFMLALRNLIAENNPFHPALDVLVY